MVERVTVTQPQATNQAATTGEMVKPSTIGANRSTPGNTPQTANDKKERFQKNQETRKQRAQPATDEKDAFGELAIASKSENTGLTTYSSLDPSTISKSRNRLHESVKAARGNKDSPLYQEQATMTRLEQILSGSSVANRKDLTMQLALAKSNYFPVMHETGRTALSDTLKESPNYANYQVVDDPSRIQMAQDIQTGLDGRENGLDAKQLAFVKQELTAAINGARSIQGSPLSKAEYSIRENERLIDMGVGSNDTRQALETAKTARDSALRDLAQKCISRARTP